MSELTENFRLALSSGPPRQPCRHLLGTSVVIAGGSCRESRKEGLQEAGRAARAAGEGWTARSLSDLGSFPAVRLPGCWRLGPSWNPDSN